MARFEALLYIEIFWVLGSGTLQVDRSQVHNPADLQPNRKSLHDSDRKFFIETTF